MALTSLIGFIEAIQKLSHEKDYEYYYRGHEDFGFKLLPGIYRPPVSKKGKHLIRSEEKIFREIIIRTPADFVDERTTIEKLVKMQHYGLPTRILDITSNPLVALYFACQESSKRNDGEVVLIKIPKDEIKFYDSDTVSILSNLSRRPVEFNIKAISEDFLAQKSLLSERERVELFNKKEPIPYLLHEIRDEKPHFLPIIHPSDFNRVLLVRVKLNNSRIVKQSGAFLLFGIESCKLNPAKVPDSWILNNRREIDLQIKHNRKRAILKDLDALGINDSTLFPELEQQSKYIKQLYEV